MQRPRRTIKPPPLTYWEEYVQTDQWYLKKIVEDVPTEELHAALHDEDLRDDEQCAEDGDESSDEEEGEGEDEDWIQLSESDSSESYATTTDAESGTEAASDNDTETTCEGELGSETEDGESTCSSVGEARPGTKT